jgi:hypothetical protein
VTGVLPLSPIDLVFTGRGAYPLEFVFAYEGRLDADRLRDSLARTLELFPPARTRLVRSGDSWGLEPSAEGCTFAVAASPARFSEDVDRHAFVDPVETVPGQPTTRVRLTHTADGSVLGVGLSHAVVDGFSYFHFLSAWSRVHLGRDAPPPFLDRTLLSPRGLGVAAASLGPREVHQGCGLFLDERRPAIPRERLRWTRRVFPHAELRELLGPAQAACPVRLSHNDVVAAWLWRAYVPVWASLGEPTTFLSCPVDVRRVLGGFPANYFGCAVALASATIGRERLAEAPLAELARRVRDAVAGVDEARARASLETIDQLRRREGLEGLERLHVVHPRAGLLVTNLSRLPVREVVFDAGPPVAYDILAPAERCAVVLPADDGLDVRICLPVG